MKDAVDAVAAYVLTGQNAVLFRKLLRAFGSYRQMMMATAKQWEVFSPEAAARKKAWPKGQQVRELYQQWQSTLQWLAMDGNSLWLADQQELTGALAQVISEDDIAPLLFLRGNSEVLHLPQIAIVGSRAASQYGLNLARTLAQELADMGLSISSGLASGIDAAAHQGALAAHGKTLAVMGCGLDRCYPPRNRYLQDQIVEAQGLLVSEFVPGTPPLPYHFPRRNHVISCLAMGVLVVEASHKSGSMITAKAASALSRQVWALPGSVHSGQSEGCHQLIRDELARLVRGAHDVLSDCLPTLSTWYGYNASTTEASKALTFAEPNHIGQEILAVMGWEQMSLDNIIARMPSLSASNIMTALGELEVQGWVNATLCGYQRAAS
ncbi:MAG: DNA-processing protein DprA [Moraxellaceae bacterium]|nr:DNA-processing protein DprA [Moraxellaceae bacterium]